jgi:hypothetical protein
MTGKPEQPQQQWHIDRAVPLVLIFGILVQTAGAFWWASSQTATNSQQDRQISELAATVRVLTDNLTERNERLARLETLGEVVNKKVDSLVTRFDAVRALPN